MTGPFLVTVHEQNDQPCETCMGALGVGPCDCPDSIVVSRVAVATLEEVADALLSITAGMRAAERHRLFDRAHALDAAGGALTLPDGTRMADREPTAAERGRALAEQHAPLWQKFGRDMAKIIESEARADERRKVIAELESGDFLRRLAASAVLDREATIKAMATLGVGCDPDAEAFLLRSVLREAASLLAPEGEGGDEWEPVIQDIAGERERNDKVVEGGAREKNIDKTSASPSSEPARTGDKRAFEFHVHGVMFAADHERADTLIGGWVDEIVAYGGSVTTWASTDSEPAPAHEEGSTHG